MEAYENNKINELNLIKEMPLSNEGIQKFNQWFDELDEGGWWRID